MRETSAPALRWTFMPLMPRRSALHAVAPACLARLSLTAVIFDIQAATSENVG